MEERKKKHPTFPLHISFFIFLEITHKINRERDKNRDRDEKELERKR